jgi:hypothetical protein
MATAIALPTSERPNLSSPSFPTVYFSTSQVAIALIAHGRLGVAAYGEAETNEQRDDRGSKK